MKNPLVAKNRILRCCTIIFLSAISALSLFAQGADKGGNINEPLGVASSLASDSSLDASAPHEAINLQTLTTEQKTQIEALGKKSLDDQLEDIKKNVPLELIATDRKGGAHYFDALGPATRKLEQITDIEGLYGKAVCPKSSGTPDDREARILIADDAPPSTLLHEYIHSLQMSDNKRWCELEGRVLDAGEKKERAVLYHRFEYEVLKTLWDLREKMKFNFEDELILVEGLHRESGVFKALGIKTLTDDELILIEKTLDDIHSKIQTLTWLTKTHEDAGSVMQKMEVVNLKSCAEQTKGSDEVKKINDCLLRRCSFTGIKCEKVTEKELTKAGDDLYSKVIFAWMKPFLNPECRVAKFRDELTDNIESPTPCWKAWYREHLKKDKSLKLKKLDVAQEAKRLKAPKLAIDGKITFYQPANPASFIASAYCFFIFQKVARFETLPIDQFAYATLGASLPLKNKDAYFAWLGENPQGKNCAKLVKIFTGDEPSDWEDFDPSKKYVLILNPLASLSGGLTDYEGAMTTDLNHERLHIVFSEDKKIKPKIKKEWDELPYDEKQKFKEDHPSYDFEDPEILYREYFSYTRQSHPQKLF